MNGLATQPQGKEDDSQTTGDMDRIPPDRLTETCFGQERA
jgi:hypothetical protein